MPGQAAPNWPPPSSSPLTDRVVDASKGASVDAQCVVESVLDCLDSLPDRALRAEKARRQRVERWLLTLLEAQSQGRIADDRLLGAVTAVREYLDGVEATMDNERSSFRPHYVRPIPGVDYGDGRFGDTVPDDP